MSKRSALLSSVSIFFLGIACEPGVVYKGRLSTFEGALERASAERRQLRNDLSRLESLISRLSYNQRILVDDVTYLQSLTVRYKHLLSEVELLKIDFDLFKVYIQEYVDRRIEEVESRINQRLRDIERRIEQNEISIRQLEKRFGASTAEYRHQASKFTRQMIRIASVMKIVLQQKERSLVSSL